MEELREFEAADLLVATPLRLLRFARGQDTAAIIPSLIRHLFSPPPIVLIAAAHAFTGRVGLRGMRFCGRFWDDGPLVLSFFFLTG